MGDEEKKLFDELRMKLQDANLRQIHRESGVHWTTLSRFKHGHIAELNYGNTVRLKGWFEKNGK